MSCVVCYPLEMFGGVLTVQPVALSRTFTAAQKAAQRPPTHPSSAAYEAQLSQLQSKQLALGKAVNDEEKLVVRREAEVSNWKEEQERLSAWEVGKEETGWDTSM